jgi:hypothetical protein
MLLSPSNTEHPYRIFQSFLSISRKAPISKVSKEARDHARLPAVVLELRELVGQWGELLSDGNLDINIFDPDSHHELLQFENYHSFEPILRLGIGSC